MKFSAAKKDLVKALSRAASVADSKNPLPILGCVLLDVGGDGVVEVIATDNYLDVNTEVQGDVAESGRAACSAKDLLERVKVMPDGPVTIETKDKGTMVVSAAGTSRRFSVLTSPAEDFPAPGPVFGSAVRAHASTLLQAIDRTIFAVSTDNTRPHVNSALFKFQGSKLTVVSTDGHRLAKSESEIEESSNLEFLAPLAAVTQVRKFLSSVEGETIVVITKGEKRFSVDCLGVAISARHVDTQFPPYQQVIPKSQKATLTVPRAALIESCAAVSVASPLGSVRLRFGADVLRVDADGPNGSASDELRVDLVGKVSKDLTIGVSSKYLRDALACLSCESVSLGVSGELDPISVEADDFLSVIMPMRVGAETVAERAVA